MGILARPNSLDMPPKRIKKVRLSIFILVVPHITISLYDSTNESISHDIYNGKYGDSGCYGDTKRHD